MSSMRVMRWVTGMFVMPAVFVVSGCSDVRTPEAGADTGGTAAPYIAATSPIEAGRYIVKIAGCNDCHTPGGLEGNLPDESGWLVGTSVGWQGPWGTTYPRNLRLSAAGMSEDEWVEMSHSRNALPPMPWENLHSLSDRDARAMYAFIRSLGAAGERMPDPVPPGVEPKTPYFVLEPVMPAN